MKPEDFKIYKPERYLMKIILFIVVFCSLLSSNCFGQSITWQKIYRNPLSNDAEGWDICTADGNNFYIAGFVAPTLPYIYILKINQYGDTLWTRILGFGGSAYAVIPSGDGGCVFTGDYGNAFAMKMNSYGDTLWARNYSGSVGYDIKKTSDGGYIICGGKTSGFDFKGYVCKTDSLGYPEWEREYFDGYTTDFLSIEESVDGNGFIVGGQRFSSNGKLCAYLARIDNLGNLVWDRKFSVGIGFTYCQSFTDKNSGFILTGSASIHNSPDSSRVYVLKTDNLGNFISSKIFSSSNYQDRSVIVKDNNNKFYVSINTRTNSQLAGSKIMSIDSGFNVIRSVTLLPDTNSLDLMSLYNIPNSTDVIGCGRTNMYYDVNLDVYAVRLDSMLAMPPPISIDLISNVIPTIHKLYQNYPNPFNPNTRIEFDVSKRSIVKISIYDILGKEISILMDKDLNPGRYNTNFLSKNLASGIYIYSISFNGLLSESKKMMLLK